MKRHLLFISLVFITLGVIAQSMPTGEYFYIQSVQAGRSNKAGYWDQPGYNPGYKQGANIAVYDKEGALGDRLYKLEKAGNGYYYIYPKNANGQGRVDVVNNKKGNGVNIRIWSCNGSSAQKFKFKHMGNGRYKIFTAHNDVVCLDARSHNNGTNIHCWEDHQGPWMEWYLVKQNGSVYKPVKHPNHPEFFVKNKDKVFEANSSTLVGSRKAYCKVVKYSNNYVDLYCRSEGWSEAYGKDTVFRYTTRLWYNRNTGEYKNGTDDYAEVGKVSSNKMELSLSGEQSGTTYKLSGASISKVFEPTPLFFEAYKNKTFVYRSYWTTGGDEGVATIKSIQKDKIVFEVKMTKRNNQALSDSKPKEFVVSYSDGRYAVGPYDPYMQPHGYVDWRKKHLDLAGDENGYSLTVKQ